MCGLVGMAGGLFHQEKKMFRDMLIFDTVRGIDSTGIFLATKQPPSYKVVPNKAARKKLDGGWKNFMVKEIGAPSNLWEFQEPDSILDEDGHITEFGCKVIIGHNRAATIGSITREFAHPHTFGSITGVHNGTIYGHRKAFDTDLASDSMAVFNSIDKIGIEETWKKLDGAAALVWWDDKDKTLHMSRNKERPLVLAEGIEGRTIFWASEPWMIEIAAARCGVKLKEHEGGVTKPLPENVHYHWKIHDDGWGIDLVGKEELEVYKKNPTNGYGGSGYTPIKRPSYEDDDIFDYLNGRLGMMDTDPDELIQCVACDNYVEQKDIVPEIQKEDKICICKTCTEDPEIMRYFEWYKRVA